MTDRSFRSTNFASQFHFGNKKENKWYQISSRKGLNCLLINCSPSKRKGLKAVILQETKPTPLPTRMKLNTRDRIPFRKQKNRQMALILPKTTRENIFKSSSKSKFCSKSNLPRP